MSQVSLNELKTIIIECGWKVKEKDNNYMEVSKEFNNNITYFFNIDILNYDTSRVMREINYISNSFDKNSYIANMVFNSDKKFTIEEIKPIANDIKSSLIQLSSDVQYKVNTIAKDVELEYEYEEG